MNNSDKEPKFSDFLNADAESKKWFICYRNNNKGGRDITIRSNDKKLIEEDYENLSNTFGIKIIDTNVLP